MVITIHLYRWQHRHMTLLYETSLIVENRKGGEKRIVVFYFIHTKFRITIQF